MTKLRFNPDILPLVFTTESQAATDTSDTLDNVTICSHSRGTDEECELLAESHEHKNLTPSQNMFHVSRDTEVVKLCGPIKL